MWMYPNGVETKELCPNCDYPYPVKVRHGRNDFGPMHDVDCPECGGCMSIVGYDCPECAVKPANTACTPTDGTVPANEPIQPENDPVISGDPTPTIGG